MFPLRTTSSYRAFCPAMISSSVLRTESSSNKYTCFSTLYRLLETRNSHLTIQCRFLSNVRQRQAILVLYATIHLTATQSHSAKILPAKCITRSKNTKKDQTFIRSFLRDDQPKTTLISDRPSRTHLIDNSYKNQPTTINSNPPTKQTMNASKTANANSRHKILNISMNASLFLPPDITPHLHSSKQPLKFLGV